MKERIKNVAHSLQTFWKNGVKIRGKNVSFTALFSAISILGILGVAIHYLGILALAIFWVKVGLKFTLAILAKITFKAFVIMGVKRAVIDWIIAPQLQKRVLKHIFPALISRLKHSGSRFGKKVAILLGGLMTVILAVVSFFSQGWALLQLLGGMILTKVATIFGFKSLWVLIGHSWIWIKTTPFGLLIQVYVYGVLIDIFAKLIPKRLRDIFRPLRLWLKAKFILLERWVDRRFGWHIEEKLGKLARRIEPIEFRKIKIRARIKELQVSRKEREEKQKDKTKSNLSALLEKKRQQKEKGWQHPDARITRFRSSDTHPRKRRHRSSD